MASTVYDIRVNYMLDDRASKGMAGIGKHAARSAKSTDKLGRSLKRLMIGAAGFLSFRLGKKLLIDYNAASQEAVITMATLVEQNLGGKWADNQKIANKLILQFSKDAARGVGTTQDYVDLARQVVGPWTQATGSVAGLNDMIKSGVTAAKAFGIAGDVAGRDIQQALMGTLRSVDRLPKLLGIGAEAWNKMVKKEGPAKAAKELLKIFNSPAIRDAARAYGKSWDGITSTLEENLQRALGRIGLPLMKLISAEFEKLNEWFDKNPKKLNEIVKSISSAFVTGFKVVKTGMKLIIANKEVIMSIAKAFLAFKGIGMAGSLLRAPFDAIRSLGTAAEGGAKGLGGFIGKLGGAAVALGLIAAGANLVADWVDRRQERNIKEDVSRNALVDLASRSQGYGRSPRLAGNQRAFLQNAREMGLGSKLEDIKGKSGIDRLMAQANLGFNDKQLKVLTDAYEQSSAAEGVRLAGVLREWWMNGPPEIITAKLKGNITKPKPPRMTVKISKIEVVSDDPDRFAFNLVGALQDFNTSPTQARKSISENR